MSPVEVAAYNAGVRDVLAIARAASARIEAKVKMKPTRYPFATEALDAIVEGAAELLKQDTAKELK